MAEIADPQRLHQREQAWLCTLPPVYNTVLPTLPKPIPTAQTIEAHVGFRRDVGQYTRGLSVAELARQAGVLLSVTQRVLGEQGSRRAFGTIYRLAKVLGVSRAIHTEERTPDS